MTKIYVVTQEEWNPDLVATFNNTGDCAEFISKALAEECCFIDVDTIELNLIERELAHRTYLFNIDEISEYSGEDKPWLDYSVRISYLNAKF